MNQSVDLRLNCRSNCLAGEHNLPPLRIWPLFKVTSERCPLVPRCSNQAGLGSQCLGSLGGPDALTDPPPAHPAFGEAVSNTQISRAMYLFWSSLTSPLYTQSPDASAVTTRSAWELCLCWHPTDEQGRGRDLWHPRGSCIKQSPKPEQLSMWHVQSRAWNSQLTKWFKVQTYSLEKGQQKKLCQEMKVS